MSRLPACCGTAGSTTGSRVDERLKNALDELGELCNEEMAELREDFNMEIAKLWSALRLMRGRLIATGKLTPDKLRSELAVRS
jgi:hypothetical protein